MKTRVLITVLVILVLYICVSGVIFHYFEYTNETVNKELFSNITQAFLGKYKSSYLMTTWESIYIYC